MKRASDGVGKLPVFRISLSYIYQLATTLELMGNVVVRERPISELMVPMLFVRGAIKDLMLRTFYGPNLRASFGPSQILLTALEKITARSHDDIRPWSDVFRIKQPFS